MFLCYSKGMGTYQSVGAPEITLANCANAVGASSQSVNAASDDSTKIFIGTTTNKKIAFVGQGGVTYGLKPQLVYEFHVGTDGGANGTYTLRGSGPIPADFVVTQGNFFVKEVFTGAGTVSLGTATGTPANILAATAIGTMGTAGSKATIPILATVGTHISVTAESVPVLVVASGPLTAGALTLVLEGYFTAIDSLV